MWRHNAYLLAKLSIIKKMKNDLKIKCKPHNNGTSGGVMPTFLAKMGVKMKNKKANLIYYNIIFSM
jgi:hypothetical protein